MDYLIFLIGLFLLAAAAGCRFLFRKMDNYLSKPITLDRLRQLLTAFVNQPTRSKCTLPSTPT